MRSRAVTVATVATVNSVPGQYFHLTPTLIDVSSTFLCKIEENDARIADGGVMAGEGEAAGLAVETDRAPSMCCPSASRKDAHFQTR
jgi:hypothetical protein